MKLNAHIAACLAALVAVACTPSVGRPQAMMMDPNGAIRLDDMPGADASAPVVINQSPEVIQTPGPQGWTGGGPMMAPTPYGMYQPQCMSCAPAMTMQSPQANLGPFQRLFKNGGLQWVAGAEFIDARATFSEALAYVNFVNATQSRDYVQLDFDYDPSYSIYGGVFLSNWGGALMFDFARMTSDASFSAQSTADNIILTPVTGANVTGSANVDVKTYDLAFSKSLYLGGDPAPAGGASCNCPTCASGNRPCWEPSWELGLEGGVRFADVEWARQVNAFTAVPGADATLLGSSSSRLSFDGFGPRLGVLGRRYIGRRGFLSAYAKGDWSLLVGDVDSSTDNSVVLEITPTHTRGTQIVPVTEIELGATANVGRFASFSAGYFWSAWHDLGMREDLPPGLSRTDDANILGFDGLFARGEVAY